MTTAVESLSRRSFLSRELVRLGARFGEVNGMAAALDFGDPAGEREAARRLALVDCSALSRTGYKGPQAIDWLRVEGVQVGEENNRAWAQEDGSLAARLAPTEVLVLGPLSGADGVAAKLDAAWSIALGNGAYRVPRADTNVWLRVAGQSAAAMFAKVCGIDLRTHKFGNGAIAQTSVARLNAIVVRDDLGPISSYHVLTDSASAGFMWSSLLDAMTEFDGRAVGLDAIRRLAAA